MLWKSSVIYICACIYTYIYYYYTFRFLEDTLNQDTHFKLFSAPHHLILVHLLEVASRGSEETGPGHIGRNGPRPKTTSWKGDECPILGHPWKQEVPEKKMKIYFCSSFAITKILLTCGIWRSKSIDKHQHAERLTLRWNSGVWVAPATRSGCSPFLRVL